MAFLKFQIVSYFGLATNIVAAIPLSFELLEAISKRGLAAQNFPKCGGVRGESFAAYAI